VDLSDYDVITPEYLSYGIKVYQSYMFSETEDAHVDLCVKASGYKNGDVVCDMGCGIGYVASVMNAMGIKTIGVTNSQFQWLYSKEHYAETTVILSDMVKTPLQEGFFDAVQWMESIGYADHESAFREAFRITNEHGRAIVKDFSSIRDAADKSKKWSYRFIPALEMIHFAEEAGFILVRAFMLNATNERFSRFCLSSSLMKNICDINGTGPSVPFWYEFAKVGAFYREGV